MKKREVYEGWVFPCVGEVFFYGYMYLHLRPVVYERRRDLLGDNKSCPCGKGCKPIKCRIIVENEV